MKQFFNVILLLALGNTVMAQSIDDIKKLIGKNDWAGAKTAVDAHLAVEKNAAKADGWYYKGVIYNEYSKSETLAPTCPTCKMDAFEAFKKYQAIDPKNILMVLEQNVRFFDLYNGFFDVGAKAFSNKDYDAAYASFQNAHKVEDYVRAKGYEYNGFKFNELDTSLVQNMALAARLAKKDDIAVQHYERLVGAGFSGESNLEMYQYLAQYYASTKNMTALDALLGKAKKLYPTNDYWIEVELDMVDKKDKLALFAKYEDITAKNPTNYALAYNYGVELFNYMYVGDTKPADFEGYKSKLEGTLKKAIAIKNSGEANLIMARHIYNDVYDVQDALKKIKGTKPEDAKKRVELRALGNKYADECIKYAGEATKIYGGMDKLKPIEKANYKNGLSILEAMYSYKGDNAKSADYKKQLEAVQ
jgi:hypothetical protein